MHSHVKGSGTEKQSEVDGGIDCSPYRNFVFSINTNMLLDYVIKSTWWLQDAITPFTAFVCSYFGAFSCQKQLMMSQKQKKYLRSAIFRLHFPEFLNLKFAFRDST